jgi:AP-2 complex subunit alpha
LLINESNDEIWRQIVHSIEADIRSRNEAAQSLALSLIATIVPDLLVTALSDTIIDLAVSSKSSTAVSKKAIMCLSRIIRKHPNNYDVKKFITPLTDMFDKKSTTLSYQNAAASFLLQLMAISNPDTLIDVQPKVVKLVHKLALYKSGSG